MGSWKVCHEFEGEKEGFMGDFWGRKGKEEIVTIL